MLIHLNEFNEPVLSEKVLFIKDLRKIYDVMVLHHDKDLAMSVFAFLHYMYHFDSKFVREYPNHKDRVIAVKKFVHRGDEIPMTNHSLKTAMRTYAKLYDEEQVSLYSVMHRNVFKLKEYADRMILFMPKGAEEDPDFNGIMVDSKEFTAVNSILPKQQKELEEFETRLLEHTKNRVDMLGDKKVKVYG